MSRSRRATRSAWPIEWVSNARLAAATATSTSPRDPSATEYIGCSVAGLTTGWLRLAKGSRHAPSIKNCMSSVTGHLGDLIWQGVDLKNQNCTDKHCRRHQKESAVKATCRVFDDSKGPWADYSGDTRDRVYRCDSDRTISSVQERCRQSPENRHDGEDSKRRHAYAGHFDEGGAGKRGGCEANGSYKKGEGGVLTAFGASIRASSVPNHPQRTD